MPDGQIDLGLEEWRVEERISRRARSVRIEIQPDGVVRLIIPGRAARPQALAFLQSRRAWIERKLADMRARGSGHAAPAPMAWDGRDKLLLRGVEVPVLITPVSMRRASVRITDEAVAVYMPAAQALTAAAMDRLLRRALADAALADARRIAASYREVLNAEPRDIVIRDPRSQWGSCTADGRISLSFRLVMAPPMVLRYVVVHELCHLRVAAHDQRFWALVGELMPDYPTWRAWLREHGAQLHLWLPAS